MWTSAATEEEGNLGEIGWRKTHTAASAPVISLQASYRFFSPLLAEREQKLQVGPRPLVNEPGKYQHHISCKMFLIDSLCSQMHTHTQSCTIGPCRLEGLHCLQRLIVCVYVCEGLSKRPGTMRSVTRGGCEFLSPSFSLCPSCFPVQDHPSHHHQHNPPPPFHIWMATADNEQGSSGWREEGRCGCWKEEGEFA